MAFDIERLVKFCVREIENFSLNHRDETFYGFAIDGSLLCLNSEEQAQKTLEEYRNKWDRLARHVEKWGDLTKEDLFDAEYLLGLEQRYNNLDRADKEACLLVINEKREETRAKSNPYENEAEIRKLRENTGDWAYQGFAEMTRKEGFDEQAYDRHYGMSDKRQLTSSYAKAMDEIILRLKDLNPFGRLNTTDDFYVTRVEHNY